VSLLAAFPARAELGGGVDSVQQDQARMEGSLQITHAAAYDVHEIKTQGGSVVREYVAGGKVFGLAWQGRGHPNLQQLLGSYFEQFQRAAQAQSQVVRRAPIMIHESGLVVEISGHPGFFVGRAYVPQMVPQGVAESQIR
jgi:hypothetical protein